MRFQRGYAAMAAYEKVYEKVNPLSVFCIILVGTGKPLGLP